MSESRATLLFAQTRSAVAGTGSGGGSSTVAAAGGSSGGLVFTGDRLRR